mgnify:FL=1
MKKYAIQILKAVFLGMSMVACSNERRDDVTFQSTTPNETSSVVATFSGAQPLDSLATATRTTATHVRGGIANVSWETTDKVWVKATDGQFHLSNAAQFHPVTPPATINMKQANFTLATGDYGFNPMVHYTGHNNPADRVTIAAAQSQAVPNDFSHLAQAGDCGSATAIGGGGDFHFTLNHKASYLCFVPRCTNVDLGPNIFLQKITLTANKPIAGTYDFTDGTLDGKLPLSASSNTITLTVNNFSLNTTTESLPTNAAYMVLAPGTYNFTIAYTIKDPLTNVEGTIVKTVNNFQCTAGKIRDVRAHLVQGLIDVSGTYFMWDAANNQNYWLGHDRVGGKYPVTLVLNGSRTADWAATPDTRWYNTGYGYKVATNAIHSAATQPNVNLMCHFPEFGDARWDANKLWIIYGHLQKGGIWIRRRTALGAANKSTDYWGINFTNNGSADTYVAHKGYASDFTGPLSRVLPTTSELPYYFFLPASGYYLDGLTYDVGIGGHYWTSSGSSSNANNAYYFYFNDHEIHVRQFLRRIGSRIATFEN